MKKLFFSLTVLYSLLAVKTSSAQISAQTYIESHKAWAIQAMETFGVPASVILAVAMHESANGTSKVATYLNNHFGIRGINNNKHINSSYKGYDSVKDSYDDFIHYLKTRKQFASLFDRYSSYDYHSWAYGIMRGGYAGSKTWAAHIVAIIKKHQLYTLDNRPADYVEVPAHTPEHPMEVSTATSTVYTVKKGDTLSTIAKRHKTTVKNIRARNNLQHDRLKIGQRLSI